MQARNTIESFPFEACTHTGFGTNLEWIETELFIGLVGLHVCRQLLDRTEARKVMSEL